MDGSSANESNLNNFSGTIILPLCTKVSIRHWKAANDNRFASFDVLFISPVWQLSDTLCIYLIRQLHVRLLRAIMELLWGLCGPFSNSGNIWPQQCSYQASKESAAWQEIAHHDIALKVKLTERSKVFPRLETWLGQVSRFYYKQFFLGSSKHKLLWWWWQKKRTGLKTYSPPPPFPPPLPGSLGWLKVLNFWKFT